MDRKMTYKKNTERGKKNNLRFSFISFEQTQINKRARQKGEKINGYKIEEYI